MELSPNAAAPHLQAQWVVENAAPEVRPLQGRPQSLVRVLAERIQVIPARRVSSDITSVIKQGQSSS